MMIPAAAQVASSLRRNHFNYIACGIHADSTLHMHQISASQIIISPLQGLEHPVHILSRRCAPGYSNIAPSGLNTKHHSLNINPLANDEND
jgi:hypothetical protein